jgi:CDGSH-type Zn-finger protein
MLNIIIVTPNGPYEIHGNLEIVSREGNLIASGDEFWLCRCGNSAEKPYCDSSHERTGFVDPALCHENKLLVDETPPTTDVLKITPNPNGSYRLSGPMELHFADGTIISGHRCALCRCRASKNKPFCDSTHKEIGFKTE